MASATDKLIDGLNWVKAKFRKDPYSVKSENSGRSRLVLLLLGVFLVLNGLLGWYWSQEPELPVANRAEQNQGIVGATTTSALIEVVNTLLDKPGGYLSNDITPPSVLLDNMPNWEFGVLVQARDLARAMRNDFSRSQSQSLENPALAEAEPLLSFSNDSWIFPATESEYRKAVKELVKYRQSLLDIEQGNAQFYARADNMAAWLSVVEKRLGGMSQRLSASIGRVRVNTDLAGDPAAQQATPAASDVLVKTSWWEIDDVFYQSRGTAWALIQFLRAAEYDFRDVLIKKNALVSLRQIIRELEATQTTLWSPIILNGSGFGVFANHSLVMASYISRANAAVIDLRRLLEDG